MPRKVKVKKKPQTDSEIALVVEEAEQSLQGLDPLPKRLRKLKMNSDKNLELVLAEGRTIRELQRSVEKKQEWAVSGLKEVVKLTRASIKRVESLFDPMKNSCQEVLEIVDQKQLEYDRWQEDELEKEQEKLRVEAEAEQKRLQRNASARAKRVLEDDPQKARDIVNSVPTVEVATAQAPVAPKVEGVTKAKVWDYEIEDPSAVPEFYSCVRSDEHSGVYSLWIRELSRRTILKVRELAATEDNPQPIEGIRFFQKDQTRYGRL